MRSSLFSIQVVLNGLSRVLSLLFVTKLIGISTYQAFSFSLAISIVPLISMNCLQFIFSSLLGKKVLERFVNTQIKLIIILIILFEIINKLIIFPDNFNQIILSLQIAFSVFCIETIYCNYIVSRNKYMTIIYYSLLNIQFLFSYFILINFKNNWHYGFILPPVIVGLWILFKSKRYLYLNLNSLLRDLLIRERIKLSICLYPFSLINFFIISTLGFINKQEIAPYMNIFNSFVGVSLFLHGNLYAYAVPSLKKTAKNLKKFINLRYICLFIAVTLITSLLAIFIYPLLLSDQKDFMLKTNLIVILAVFIVALSTSINQWVQTILIMENSKFYIGLVNLVLILFIVPSIYFYVSSIEHLLIVISIAAIFRSLSYIKKLQLFN